MLQMKLVGEVTSLSSGTMVLPVVTGEATKERWM